MRGEFWVSQRLLLALTDGYRHDGALLPQERKLLSTLADGKTMAQIAAELAIAERTARGYLAEATRTASKRWPRRCARASSSEPRY